MISAETQDIAEIQYLVRLFLVVFLLIGVAPFVRKRILGFIDYLLSLRRSPAQSLAETVYNPALPSLNNSRMEGIDYLVFVQLAQAGEKGVALKTLERQLHMEGWLITGVLLSLNKRELVRVERRLRFNSRFYLSKKGKDLSIAQGMAYFQ